jgi:hypothetical protein
MVLPNLGSDYPLHPEGFDSLDKAWSWIIQHYPENHSDIFVKNAPADIALFMVFRKKLDETFVMCGTYWRKLRGSND